MVHLYEQAEPHGYLPTEALGNVIKERRSRVIDFCVCLIRFLLKLRVFVLIVIFNGFRMAQVVVKNIRGVLPQKPVTIYRIEFLHRTCSIPKEFNILIYCT